MEKIEKRKIFYLLFCIGKIKIEIFNKNFRDKNMNEKNLNIKIAVIGGLAGIICGLFGTGGGMILVPAFIYMLDIEPKKARATSLCCMLAMVIASSFFYYKNNYINWNSGLLCAIGGIFGGYIGAIILKKVPDYILKILFTIFILYYAYRMLFVL